MNAILIIIFILIFFILYQCYQKLNIPLKEYFNLQQEYIKFDPVAFNDDSKIGCRSDIGVMSNYTLNKENAYTNIWETPIQIMNTIFKDIITNNHNEDKQLKKKLFKLSKNKKDFTSTITTTRLIYNRLSEIGRKILKQINDYLNTKHYNSIQKKQKFMFKTLDVVYMDTNNIIVNFHIYRPYKQHQYVIYIHLLKDTQDIDIKNYIIKEMKIIGKPLEPIIEPIKRETCQQKVNQEQLKGDNLKLIFRDNKVVIDNPEISKHFQAYLENLEKNEHNKLSKCFHPHKEFETLPYSFEEECTSYHQDLKCFGVWDKPCKNDSDCPFYSQKKKKNKSPKYGCNTKEPGKGLCNMPEGVKRVGYTYYRK